jgi:hypothetical protein
MGGPLYRGYHGEGRSQDGTGGIVGLESPILGPQSGAIGAWMVVEHTI